MNRTRGWIVFGLIAALAYCLYLINAGSLSDRETAILSLMLAVLSTLASWTVTEIYSRSQYKAQIKEIKDGHRASLETYARKAAEKVNNLSNELGKLATYLDDELERTDIHDPNILIISREERITSAIHLISTLKSVNDTALSDWEGVVDDILAEQREVRQRQEEELKEIAERVQALIEDDADKEIGNSDISREEFDTIKRDLRSLTLSMGVPPKKFGVARKSKIAVRNQCPLCGNTIEYQQKPKDTGYKVIECGKCGKQLISRYRNDKFDLEERRIVTEPVKCPTCGNINNIPIDITPFTTCDQQCQHCKTNLHIRRTVLSGITVKIIGPSGDETEIVEDEFPEAIIEKVRTLMPPQPWPTGAHRIVAEQLSISPSKVQRILKLLTKRGVFKLQIEGKIYAPIDAPPKNP